MDKQIIDLFKRFINDACSPSELEKVLTYIKNGDFLEEWDAAIKQEENF